MTTPHLARANSAAAAARLHRAEYLMSVTLGLLSVDDVFATIATPGGADLARIPLRQLMLAPENASRTAVDRQIERMRELLGTDVPVRNMTLTWLFDSRCGGRRYQAYLDATRTDRSGPPWPGFPATPAPQAAGKERASADV